MTPDDLLYLDCESTGPDPILDRLTEVSVVRTDGTVVFTSLVHPGRSIPEHVQRLTNISEAMVTAPGVPFFHEIAWQLADVLRDRPLCGFGCTEFDVPLLAEEFERAGVPYSFGPVLDVGHLYKALRPRTLAAAVAEFGGRDHHGAHRATADALAVAEVLDGMRRAEPRADRPLADLIAFARGERVEKADPAGRLQLVNGVVCFGDRQRRGTPVAEDLSYARWMLSKDFPLSTQRVLRAEVERVEAELEREAEARWERERAAKEQAVGESSGGQPVPAADAVEIPF